MRDLWTSKLILNIEQWVRRDFGEVNYFLNHFFSVHERNALLEQNSELSLELIVDRMFEFEENRNAVKNCVEKVIRRKKRDLDSRHGTSTPPSRI